MTMAQYPRPELGYRAVLGLLRAGEKHTAARFDAACAYALQVSGSTVPRRKYIEALLKKGLERAPLAKRDELQFVGVHENVRGGSYCDKENGHAD